jgi:hypothetical protein
MTTTDKTRQKLVDSMRKSRAASVNNPPVEKKGTVKKKKRVTKKRSRPDSVKSKAPQSRLLAGNGSDRRLKTTDPYQGGCRVWPD